MCIHEYYKLSFNNLPLLILANQKVQNIARLVIIINCNFDINDIFTFD